MAQWESPWDEKEHNLGLSQPIKKLIARNGNQLFKNF